MYRVLLEIPPPPFVESRKTRQLNLCAAECSVAAVMTFRLFILCIFLPGLVSPPASLVFFTSYTCCIFKFG